MIALPDGFKLIPGWASGYDLEALTAELGATQQTIRIYGREVAQPRLTRWMGDRAYTYSGRRHEPDPMTPTVAAIRRALEASLWVPDGTRFNTALANVYRDGADSVAAHSDDEPELGPEPVIASVSIGAPRAFVIRPKTGGASTRLVLRDGDLLVMSGRSQADYTHAIPKTAQHVGPRVNLTYRRVFTEK